MKALVLAGGLPQIALIKALQRRGIYAVLADYFSDPVAKPYADKFYQVSTLDVPGITRIAREENVDFLITVCTDQALLTVAQVSEDLSLPCYIDYQTALNVTNKSYMKRVFARENISTARFEVMEELDRSRIQNLRYPLIVKPVDCNSSKGVCRVERPELLEAAFEEAVRLSRTKTAIVEEFIVGPELSVDVYVENGKAKVLAISQLDKIPEEDKFVIFRSKSPEKMSKKVYDQICVTAQQIADAFGLTDSPMLIQMISDGEAAYVLEFSARTGGGEKFSMIRRVAEFDVVDAVVELTLGNKPQVNDQVLGKKHFASEFLYGRPGIFDKMVGVESLLEQGILCDFYQFKSSGTACNTITSSGDRIAGYSIIADTKEELVQKHNKAKEILQMLDVNGKDIMRRDLLTDLYDE